MGNFSGPIESFSSTPLFIKSWIAADSYRLDPNEWWALSIDPKDEPSWIVVGDGDFKSRCQVLVRDRDEFNHETKVQIFEDLASRGYDVAAFSIQGEVKPVFPKLPAWLSS